MWALFSQFRGTCSSSILLVFSISSDSYRLSTSSSAGTPTFWEVGFDGGIPFRDECSKVSLSQHNVSLWVSVFSLICFMVEVIYLLNLWIISVTQISMVEILVKRLGHHFTSINLTFMQEIFFHGLVMNKYQMAHPETLRFMAFPGWMCTHISLQHWVHATDKILRRMVWQSTIIGFFIEVF